MLGENGREQFVVTTYQDGKRIAEQKIHVPFIRCTVTICISRWDLFKAMLRKQFQTKINVCVDASEGMVRTIMMLDPDSVDRETMAILDARRKSREDGAAANNCYIAGG